MNYPHVFQDNEAYCGPAVAQMVLKHYGIDLAQQDIAKELETDMVVGTSVKELTIFFEKHGFVVGQKNNATWHDLAEAVLGGPTVVGYVEHGGDPHYALVSAVDEGKIVLHDPWHGPGFVLSKPEFEERWKDNDVGQYGKRMLLQVISKKAN